MRISVSIGVGILLKQYNMNIVNINVGVLGHVDSGKTSLVRTLSKIASTASLDKNPQSQERGITLDLGFTAFDLDGMQITLVDCPGHASLIKTIIGGAQIIDLMLLVIDVNKGIQTQTAECLVIGEILADKMIVVVNKIDLCTEQEIEKQINQLRKVFTKTKFTQAVPIVALSATEQLNIEGLLSTLKQTIVIRDRTQDRQKGLLFLIDHCFQIKGQGTVTTGTILQGTIKVGDDVNFPMLALSKKVKSLQMFKKPIQSAGPGDRVAALFNNLEANLIERGIVSAPGVVQSVDNVVILMNRVQYYKGSIKSQNKFHITSGHETVMGQLKLFARPKGNNLLYNGEGEYVEDLDSCDSNKFTVYGLIQFEKPLFVSQNGLIIASKLDTDLEANICRIAFYSNILYTYQNNQIFKEQFLRIFRKKTKYGIVEKIIDNYTLLIKDLFKKETNINNYIGKIVILKLTQNQGKIEASFGKSGKVKVFFEKEVTFNLKEDQNLVNTECLLLYKKYLFNK